MLTRQPRTTRLVVVVTAAEPPANDAAGPRAKVGLDCVVYYAHGVRAGLRIATALGPDLVLIDDACSPRLGAMLRGHPLSARAGQLRLPLEMLNGVVNSAAKLAQLLTEHVDAQAAAIPACVPGIWRLEGVA